MERAFRFWLNVSGRRDRPGQIRRLQLMKVLTNSGHAAPKVKRERPLIARQGNGRQRDN